MFSDLKLQFPILFIIGIYFKLFIGFVYWYKLDLMEVELWLFLLEGVVKEMSDF